MLPQDYCLLKMKVLEIPETIREAVKGKELFFVAGTLRPETMHGQTNIWVKPDGDYGVFEISEDVAFVCGDRAAYNLSFQGQSLEFGKVKCLARINGQSLIGTPVSSPNCKYERIYALPMETILMNKATGIVTSVPSDAPDDWQNLQDLKNDATLREKFKVKDEWVMPFEAVPIVNVPELGDLSAQAACKAEGVKNRDDSHALKKAKASCYLHGFHSGVMLVGPYAGKTVEAAKPLMKQDLIDSGAAIAYSEPADLVVSRSGEECVVSLTDQWSITYGQEEWKNAVLEYVKSDEFEGYSSECKLNLERTLDWMGPWGVSRTYGLGSRLPWDRQYLIESLSDSTIYMAYYTIAHYLHGDLFGKTSGKANIKPEQMTHEVWDYIFLGKGFPKDTTIDKGTLEAMRTEFDFWYPFDVRCSGRDLIGNHLTMCLYHHAAVFPKDKWPKGIRCCGFLLLNEDKMAKSTGNFLTLAEGLEKFGCDAMRLTLARAGDQMSDGNFNEHEAEQAILTLHTLVRWVSDVYKSFDGLRKGAKNFFDTLIEDHINTALVEARQEFQKSMFRAGIEGGFTFLLNNWSKYMCSVGDLGLAIGPHAELVQSYVTNLAILLAPVCPHVAEELWSLSGNAGLVVNALWPDARPSNARSLLQKESYFEDLCKEARRLHKLASGKKEVTLCKIFICAGAPEWQQKAKEIVAAAMQEDPKIDFNSLMKKVSSDPSVSKAGKSAKKMIPNVVKQAMQGTTQGFDEMEFLTSLKELIEKKVGFPVVLLVHGKDAQTKAKAPQPLVPSFDFE